MPFSHEKLTAYRRAIEFVAWSQPVIDGLAATVSARQQLERASASIALNLAEGNAKFSPKDRGRFFQMASGSAMECAACLDVLVARNKLVASDVDAGKTLLLEVVNLTMGLLRHLEERIREETGGSYVREDESIIGATGDFEDEDND
jgi:four helix bundle protein